MFSFSVVQSFDRSIGLSCGFHHFVACNELLHSNLVQQKLKQNSLFRQIRTEQRKKGEILPRCCSKLGGQIGRTSIRLRRRSKELSFAGRKESKICCLAEFFSHLLFSCGLHLIWLDMIERDKRANKTNEISSFSSSSLVVFARLFVCLLLCLLVCLFGQRKKLV